MSDIPAIEKAKSETIRILLVEDDDGCALVMQNILERWRYRAFNVRRAENLSAALRQVAQGEIDLVLLDLGLPDSQGLDTFGRMHAAAANVPIVVLTGLDDEELAATTVQQGAQDYLVKGPVDGVSLARAIRYAIERCRAQQALRESEERYRTLFDQASDGIMVMPVDGKGLVVNESFARMHGYSPQEMENLHLQDLDTPETSRLAPERRRRLMAGEKLSFEVEHYHKDGRSFPLSVSASLVQLQGQLCFLGFHRDITEHKRAEQKLKDYQEHLEELVGVRTADLKHANERLEGQDKARSEFISNVSHELKTPLAALNFGLDNMLQGVVGPLPAPCRSYLDMMRYSCQRLQKTVGDVLDMASIDANTLRLNRVRVPLSILVQNIVESMQTQMDAKSLQVALSLPKRAGFVECDRHRIERVVVNVLGNAIKFTPEGGEIQIALRSAPATPGFLVLDIADNGVGIPAEHLPHVTKRYYRGAHRVDGAGLGLSISSEILTLHGGAIVLTSPPPGKDKGTLVSLRLPAVEPPTVFVAGGEEVCHPISAQFLAHGYRVQVFRHDSEAVAAMQRETPYVAILDFSMASLETAGTIAQIRGNPDLQCVRLIALTEADIPETKRQILAGFAIPALKKPWHENDLFACLEQTVLGSRRDGAE